MTAIMLMVMDVASVVKLKPDSFVEEGLLMQKIPV